MSLATLNDIASINSLEYEIAKKVENRVYDAEQTIRKWIGDEKYEDMVAAGSAADYKTAESNREYADTEYTNTVRAEALLAFACALPQLNMKIAEKGGLIKSTGFAESFNSIMGKRELDNYVREISAKAHLLMREMIYNGVISSSDREGETFVL